MSYRLETLITSEELQNRIRELAHRISNTVGSEEVLLVGLLKGSFYFLADLSRAMGDNVKIDFMQTSSYGDEQTTSGEVKLLRDLDQPLEGKNVIVVEDIVDTGLTLHYVLNLLKARNPKLLQVVSLLNKPDRRRVDVPIDYVGFEIPDRFVVGYGLDYADRFRNLSYIAVYHQE